jgi:hypothetical protein
VQQGGRANDQDGAGLGFAGGSWRQQQAQLAVGDPARLQDLAVRVTAEVIAVTAVCLRQLGDCGLCASRV